MIVVGSVAIVLCVTGTFASYVRTGLLLPLLGAGAVVVVLAAWAVGSAFSSADVRSEGGYEVTASFDNVAGLEPGAEVRMVGLPIGTVLSAELEPQSYRAKVTMIILDYPRADRCGCGGFLACRPRRVGSCSWARAPAIPSC